MHTKVKMDVQCNSNNIKSPGRLLCRPGDMSSYSIKWYKNTFVKIFHFCDISVLYRCQQKLV